MTERLYYTDSYAAAFDAVVLRVGPIDGHRSAVLDRTAFYPTSGGQPFDTGTLGSARVLEVLDGEDGTIVHRIEGDLPIGPVHGQIDWDRRFDHMQQHTGQHVLSAAFDRLFAVRTESFHLGSSSSTIDLARQVTAAEIEQAAREANRVVWEDRPVHIRFADAAEAARLPLRKEPARAGVLRIVDVEDFDVSACGGTHVARTGGSGIIVVASWEKFKGGSRIEFLCGGRALAGFGALRDTVAASVRQLSVLPAQVPEAIERTQADLREALKRVKDLHGRLASFEAAALCDRAVARGSRRTVVEAIDGADANGLKAIATGIAARPGYVAVLFSTPEPASVVVASAVDSGVDSAGILAQLTGRFGGRGGGRAPLAQGGGLQGGARDMLSFAREVIDGDPGA